MKHKHYDLIVAWANGKKIEARLNGGEWHELSTPAWNGIDTEYRIKPEPKPDMVVYSRLIGKFMITSEGIEIQQLIVCELKDRPNIKYTFDGEWGKLKSAEVL